MEIEFNPSRQALISSGLDPEMVPSEQLFRWLQRPRLPVLFADDPLVIRFVEAMLKAEPVTFIYVGGSEPGAVRTVHVSLVFAHEPAGRIYISGYCPERSATRVFALDSIMLILTEYDAAID